MSPVTFIIAGKPFREPQACACGSHGFVGLTRGFVAFFDPSDAEKLSGLSWSILKNKNVIYAASHEKTDARSTIYMHRIIAGPARDELVDHRNGDGLVNYRANLRVCDNRRNIQNRRVNKGCRYKGVSRVKSLYQARITHGGRRISLGYFQSEEAAARAYDRAAVELFGEFARPNFEAAS